ncbi:putative neddylation of cullins play an essential role in the regulation of SCF-type complexes activity [Lyophyllum shimeji]|uniref:Defective in cullin neddylation protein n=1 Tax=Lyophyllum shimeji TaxID=47721 RepID=A0A9P3ULA7_LYOSH|nr:putative neddylation of cullins play an essential role in the regulation of SCF-type complexes activity [Lyophyllum shimeji]
MPPKRKRTDDTAAAATSSTRGTRSSTRQSRSTTTAASTKKSTAKKNDEVEDQTATITPPAKKSKTTKSDAKATAASKSAKTTTAKTAAASSSKGAEKSGAPKSSDDDTIARKHTLPETPTSSTIYDLPPKSGAPAKAVPPPSPPGANEPYTAARSLLLFKAYADSENPSVIGPEGYERLCMDAKIPLDGAAPLILSWQLGAKEMGKVTEAEWRKGTEALQVSKLHALALAVTDLESLLIHNNAPPEKKAKEAYDKTAYWKYCADKKDAFRKLYAFCFNFAKPEQSKNIEMETATALWSVLLVPQYPLMSEVIEFINSKPTTYKAANKDLWNMMLEFCETVNPNLSDYESDGAWPTLLDDFVLSKKGPTATTNGSGYLSSTGD